ncbi:MAG: hypothetical protein K1X83_06620 [Oligoflexia bacterium]|nr:hypothetical protein [Oligoflexia bacterium]
MNSPQRLTQRILEQARAGDMRALKSVPKTDLHAHVDLSCPFNTYSRIARGRITIPPERFCSLDHFLEFYLRNYLPYLLTPRRYLETIRDAFSTMITDGVIYTEPSFDLFLLGSTRMAPHEFIKLLSLEVKRVAARLRVAPTLGLARNFSDPELNWQELAEEYLETGFFEAIDIYGAETLKPLSEFDSFVGAARRRGIKVKLHSGETGAPERIRSELHEIEPDQLQHGVRAAESPELLQELAQRGLLVNVCPTSNYALRVVEHFTDHPAARMLKAGVRVTINSDDYAVFGSSVSEEYLALYTQGVMNVDQLEQARLNGLSAMR